MKKVLSDALGTSILITLIAMFSYSFIFHEDKDISYFVSMGFLFFNSYLMIGYLRYRKSKKLDVKKVLIDALVIGIYTSLIGIIYKQFFVHKDWDLSYLVPLGLFSFTVSLLVGYYNYRQSKKQREKSQTDKP